MKKTIRHVILVLLLLAAAFLYYYITIPAFNLHSIGTWWFLIGAIVALSILSFLRRAFREREKVQLKPGHIQVEVKAGAVTKIGFALAGILLLILLIGSIASSPIVNAKKYQQLMTVEERDFANDISQVDYNTIPILYE